MFLPEQFGSSVVINMLTGEYEIEELREEDGNYMLDVWIPPIEEVEQMTQEVGADRNSGFVGPR